MQQFPAWMRSKRGLFILVMLTLGVGLVAGSYMGGLGVAQPAASDALSQQPDDSSDLPPGVLDEPQPSAPAHDPVTTTPAIVVVDVSGAVLRPDAYILPAAARVKDAVLAAGGFAEDADPALINLAEHIVDAQKIHVPRQGEAPPAVAVAPADAPAEGGTLVNINTASAAELEGLDGIGQALAQRIVEYRVANGPFQAVEELQKVKGISAGLVAKLAPLITTGS